MINLIRGEPDAMPEINEKYRYRLLYEKEGIYSAYYFSVPIYNKSTDSLASISFAPSEGGAYLEGVNARVVLRDDVHMENSHGSCRISMPRGYRYENAELVRYEGIEVYPTLNGIACLVELEAESKYTFRISIDAPITHVNENKKCFCAMLSGTEPFVNISCIGSLNSERELISPTYIRYRMIGAREFEISVCSYDREGKYLFFEINLHAPKLFLDTTVESKNPELYNAFGGTAFIGESEEFGEQRLYCRPLVESFGGIKNAEVKKAVLYLPKLDGGNTLLWAHPLTTRFCSFASNWNNKKPTAYRHVLSEIKNGCQVFDLTDMIVEGGKIISSTEGWMIRRAPQQEGFCAISTADSFFSPQFLEVVFE